MPIGAPGEKLPEPDARYTSMIVILSHPLSRGTVHICSADPLMPPAIDPGYLTHETDIDVMVEGVKFARKLMVTGPLGQHHVEHVHPRPVQSDNELREFCRRHTASTWHPLGTASMRPREDGGVVDSKLLVYGTKNLRVVSKHTRHIGVVLVAHSGSG